jgi:flavin-dependent dehydrogenase
MQVDTIIIGQGLCGTMLSWHLMKAGQQVMVIDESKPFSATKVASGVINPVTGRRIVRTWEIELFMPFAVNAYTELGKELGVHLIDQCNILDFHSTPQNKIAFSERLPKGNGHT